jgi:hypothetical protein
MSVQRTSGDLRVQRREPCDLRRTFDGEWVGSPCIHLEDPHRCDGCNGDGNRWVTVGTLRPPMTDDLMEKPTYVIEEYVIEEASDAAG